jgi:hypothetical protein
MQLCRTDVDRQMMACLMLAALHYAAMEGSVGAVSGLVKAGASVSPQDSHGMTPLTHAVSHILGLSGGHILGLSCKFPVVTFSFVLEAAAHRKYLVISMVFSLSNTCYTYAINARVCKER